MNLFTLPDSTFVKTEFTDQDGTYLISDVNQGRYFILVKQFGYDNYQEELEISNSTEVPTIALKSNAQELEGVEVKQTTPFIERKIDRVVVTPDALIANAGNSALEVLERAPGVTVDQNGVILLKGRSGVAVFINDKPSYLSGTELENYLRTLPAESIKNLSLIHI